MTLSADYPSVSDLGKSSVMLFSSAHISSSFEIYSPPLSYKAFRKIVIWGASCRRYLLSVPVSDWCRAMAVYALVNVLFHGNYPLIRMRNYQIL